MKPEGRRRLVVGDEILLLHLAPCSAARWRCPQWCWCRRAASRRDTRHRQRDQRHETERRCFAAHRRGRSSVGPWAGMPLRGSTGTRRCGDHGRIGASRPSCSMIRAVGSKPSPPVLAVGRPPSVAHCRRPAAAGRRLRVARCGAVGRDRAADFTGPGPPVPPPGGEVDVVDVEALVAQARGEVVESPGSRHGRGRRPGRDRPNVTPSSRSAARFCAAWNSSDWRIDAESGPNRRRLGLPSASKVGSAMSTPFSRMHAAYGSNASWVSTGDVGLRRSSRAGRRAERSDLGGGAVCRSRTRWRRGRARSRGAAIDLAWVSYGCSRR